MALPCSDTCPLRVTDRQQESTLNMQFVETEESITPSSFLLRHENEDVAPSRALDIAVVLPTFNERENVAEVIDRLAATLAGLKWELIFVDDDSPDGTAEAVRAIAT